MYDPAQAKDAPTPSAELVLLSVFIQAHLASLPRKQAERLLRTARQRLTRYSELAEAPRLRPSAQDTEIAKVIAEANVWFRASLPAFLANL